VAGHQFPKRDDPYAEDMGRRGRRITITAYVIGAEYQADRDTLIEAMEAEGPGLLIHPTGGQALYQPEGYSKTESRLKGNLAEFELTFVEPGDQSTSSSSVSTAAIVNSTADDVGDKASASVDRTLAKPNEPVSV
jgi:prophage DNA circulation protein